MAGKAPVEIPAGMRTVCPALRTLAEFAPGRIPIPEGLWAAAAEVAREHGVFRTAKVLRLEYGKLKRMAEAAPAARQQATFLELMPAHAMSLSECLIDLEGVRGKMRIRWKGTVVPDLASLSRVLSEPPA